jgi:ABC-2 type transport system ATP-binding protein
MRAALLAAHEVSKVYAGNKVAVDRFSLELGPGVLGLLGPNGAGKSSLMRILATITRPTSGRVTWSGDDIVKDPEALRRMLGYLPQDFGTYPHLTAREFLSYLAAAKGLSARSAKGRIEELLELVNLADVGKRPLGKFSGGMRQRVGIAQALLNDPKLLILDEPTAGLDPEERTRFRSLLSDLARDRIVILSTHIVSDIEAVAEDIAIVVGGRLRRRGNPAQMLAVVDGFVWESLIDPVALPAFRERHLVDRAVVTPHGVRTRVLAQDPPTPDATRMTPDLEDVYLATVRGWGQDSPTGVGR